MDIIFEVGIDKDILIIYYRQQRLCKISVFISVYIYRSPIILLIRK